MSDNTLVGIDSNVLLRYVVRDDEAQTELAARFMDSLSTTHKGFVSIVALIETIWVLGGAYGHTRQAIREFIALLLSSPMIQVQLSRVWERVLNDNSLQNKDLSDAVIVALGAGAGCIETVTFDKRASKIAGMRLLK